jgi:formamidopyrimidine-DNA glycosylase
MPELPDILIYIEALQDRILHQTLKRVRLASPFLCRTADPPLAAAHGQPVTELRRLGKRIAIHLENDLWLVLHLMIAGRLHWREPAAELPGKRGLAAFDFPNGTFLLTEAGSNKRASLQVVHGENGLDTLDPGGLEVFEATLDTFTAAIKRENHTLKRALTDARIFSGIGNAYSDEILHRARLSPFALSQNLPPDQIKILYGATREILTQWTEILRDKSDGEFPTKVTAFHEEMSVHGKFDQPCPICGDPIQRIRFASRETNYCATCQTGGKLYAGRGLSRLLKKDWSRTLEELENLKNS